MTKITLLCNAGMSTSMLVTKMQEAAKASGFECEINAYPSAEAQAKAADSDVILIGPQIRFQLSKIKALFPNIPVEAIDMRVYGRMDGAAALELAKSLVK